MTADTNDLTPEAVDRLLSLPRLYLDDEGDLCCERTGYNLVACPARGDHPIDGLLNPDMWEAIPQFQALAWSLDSENARLRADRDEQRERADMVLNGFIAWDQQDETDDRTMTQCIADALIDAGMVNRPEAEVRAEAFREAAKIAAECDTMGLGYADLGLTPTGRAARSKVRQINSAILALIDTPVPQKENDNG